MRSRWRGIRILGCLDGGHHLRCIKGTPHIVISNQILLWRHGTRAVIRVVGMGQHCGGLGEIIMGNGQHTLGYGDTAVVGQGNPAIELVIGDLDILDCPTKALAGIEDIHGTSRGIGIPKNKPVIVHLGITPGDLYRTG